MAWRCMLKTCGSCPGGLGHSSVRRGDYRYFLRFPEADTEEV
jgi:hypothetical protein